MRIHHFCAFSLVLLAGMLGWDVRRAESANIEAKSGKTYLLTKEHGPWMIMVASFGATLAVEEDHKEEQLEQQMKNANKAAHQLVLELRRKKIPAYIYSQKGKLAEIDAPDRFGNRSQRFEAAQRNRICVIAGNYFSTQEERAQKTLKFIKNMKPESLKDGVYKPTPSAPGPLSRAFMIMNPLFDDAEIAEHTKQDDPLILKLNSGTEYSLLENKGKFTLTVASFYGNSQTHVMSKGLEEQAKRFAEFDRKIKYNSSLDFAGQQAWELVKVMRKQGMEAYVFHDRFRSIVTVGSFDMEQDPRAREIYEKFKAKMKRNPENGEEVLVAEAIQIPGDRPNDPPQKSWTMDPNPQLMRVPRVR